MTRTLTTVLALSALAVAGWTAPASAQFYKGKTVSMLINFAAGGPTDIEGRIIAQHLPKHIPGNPRVIVRNMGGGGGMIATNHLGEVVKPDGLTFGFFTWNILAGILGDPGLRVDYADFRFVAGSDNPIVFYIRRDTPPGIQRPEDLMKTSGFNAISLGARNTNTIQQILTLDLLGIQYKAVPGYQGLKDVEAAILRNEGQFANTSLPGWRGSIEPTMGKEVIPLWHLVDAQPDGTIKRSAALPDLPTFEEYYQKVKGGQPSGIEYDALRLIIDTFTSMFRTAFLPPKTPNEAVEIMRAAFTSLWQDEAFMSDLEKRVRNRPALIVGEEGEKRIRALTRVRGERPEVTEFLEKLLQRLSS